MGRNRELGEGKLLDNQGRLTEAGYAKKLIKEYSRKDICASGLRIKEWDYYYVGNDKYGAAFTIADNSYMGLIGASIIDLENAKEKTVNIIKIMPNGKYNMPASSESGDVLFQDKRVAMSFKKNGSEREIKMIFRNFDNGEDFKAAIKLNEPENNDSIVIATPFDGKPKAFYYNQKIVGMRASGGFEIGNKKYSLNDESSFGLLDWGRGVWTYKNTWYWSAAQGIVDGKIFGFNLGYGFGNTSAASENMLFYCGQGHKIDDVVFNIPMKDGKEDYLSPWTIESSDSRINLTFSPILDRASCTNAFVLCSDQHQVFGRFNGTAVLDDGNVLEIKNLTGFAEKVFNKW